MESNILKPDFNKHDDANHEQTTSKTIELWLKKLASFLPVSNELSQRDNSFKREYLNELVSGLMEENYPAEAWSSEARRFIMKRCKFFPGLKDLYDLLNEYTLPIKEAASKKYNETIQEKVLSFGIPGMTINDINTLNSFNEIEKDGFKAYAKETERTVKQARKSRISFIRQYNPKVYEYLIKEGRISEDD